VNAALVALVVLASVSVAAGLVYVIRARTRHERATAAAGVLLTVLVWGGPALLWQCGEDDCGPLKPAYWVALAMTAGVLVTLLWRGRA
jgi:hypothetical protein